MGVTEANGIKEVGGRKSALWRSYGEAIRRRGGEDVQPKTVEKGWGRRKWKAVDVRRGLEARRLEVFPRTSDFIHFFSKFLLQGRWERGGNVKEKPTGET